MTSTNRQTSIGRISSVRNYSLSMRIEFFFLESRVFRRAGGGRLLAFHHCAQQCNIILH